MGVHVVKLGGSLLDMPDVPARFAAFRATCPNDHFVLIVGGGDGADLIRAWDKLHHLTEEQGHWLAVRAMQLNAYTLATRLDAHRLVCDPTDCTAAWSDSLLALVDPLPWLEREDAAGINTPKEWAFTSDSIAAHIAVRVGATQLTLLKSTLPTRADDLGDVVDTCFVATARHVPHVQLVNLRVQPFERFVLR